VSAVIIGVLPFLLVVFFLLRKGLPVLLNLDFYTQVEHPAGVPGGGMKNAIAGTLLIIAMASVMSVPIGVLAGIFLAEYGKNRLGDTVRFVSDVLTSLPSIILGIFAYSLLVATLGHFSALAGSLALAVLMLPTLLRTTEASMVLVPVSVREAGYALGVQRWRVTMSVVLPAASGGITTGILLGLARAAGETAPLLFTSLGSPFLNLDPSKPTQTLSLIVFRNALLPYPDLQNQAWGAALLLVLLVTAAGILARVYVARLQRWSS
jgi:phosphate transport system permease protein